MMMNMFSGSVVLTGSADGVLTARIPMQGIRIDGGTQSRVSLHEPTVAEYAEVVSGGGQLPAVIIYDDGAEIWLADGFHRYHGHKAAGAEDILCEVRFGTRRDAILHSVGANAAHGLRRTNNDKRRAVMTLLADPEWSTWTQGKIAEACGVSREFVSRLSTSAPHHVIGSQDATRTVERNGVTYQQNTANIGKAGPKGELEQLAPAEMHPNLDASAQAAPQLTADEIRTRSPAPADGGDDGVDLAQLADELQKENETYQRQIQSLAADDPKAELVRLNLHLDQLNGRLQGEITTRNEAQKMAKHYAGLLERIRKVLKVESNREILAALEAR
jgi:hypothetical protein